MDAVRTVPVPSTAPSLHLAAGADEEWARRTWTDCTASAGDRLVVPLPAGSGGGEAVVKVYRPRAKHNLLRRLSESRAAREGKGYEAFAARGIRTARLLFWGEERRWGLFRVGAVATVRAAVSDTVARAFARTGDRSVIDAAFDELIAIHRAGLAHGDPRLRNFLATAPRPLAIDLPSWSPLGRISQAQDLIRFLGSAAIVAGGLDPARALLDRYAREGPRLMTGPSWIIVQADRYREEKREP